VAPVTRRIRQLAGFDLQATMGTLDDGRQSVAAAVAIALGATCGPSTGSSRSAGRAGIRRDGAAHAAPICRRIPGAAAGPAVPSLGAGLRKPDANEQSRESIRHAATRGGGFQHSSEWTVAEVASTIAQGARIGTAAANSTPTTRPSTAIRPGKECPRRLRSRWVFEAMGASNRLMVGRAANAFTMAFHAALDPTWR